MQPIGAGQVSLMIQSQRTALRRNARMANYGGRSSSGSRSTASTWRSLNPTWESSPTEVTIPFITMGVMSMLDITRFTEANIPNTIKYSLNLSNQSHFTAQRLKIQILWVHKSGKRLITLPCVVATYRLEYFLGGRILWLYSLWHYSRLKIVPPSSLHFQLEKVIKAVFIQIFLLESNYSHQPGPTSTAICNKGAQQTYMKHLLSSGLLLTLLMKCYFS